MDYFTRYGLEFNPFIKNSKEILVDTSEYKETLFRLDYLAKTKGFGLLTGAAIEAILNAADGTPRLINKYCNASMLLGDSNKANLITTDIVMQALNDCELG